MSLDSPIRRAGRFILAGVLGLAGLIGLIVLIGLTSGLTRHAAAQGSFPDRPLRVIVPQPPGGGFDFVTRVLAERLGKLLGQNVLVENRPGSGTLIGTELAAKAAPDGYTLLTGSISNLALNMGLYRNLPYDSLRRPDLRDSVMTPIPIRRIPRGRVALFRARRSCAGRFGGRRSVFD